MGSDFSTIFSVLIPRDQRKHDVRQAQPPMLGKAKYTWEVALYPRVCRYRQTPTAIHPIGTALKP